MRPEALRFLEMTVDSDDIVCLKKAKPYHNNFFCSLPISRLQTTCIGDSGGPLFLYKDEKFIQIGILSRGFSKKCKPGAGAVFIEVSKYLIWIKKNMQ